MKLMKFDSATAMKFSVTITFGKQKCLKQQKLPNMWQNSGENTDEQRIDELDTVHC